MIKRVWDGTQRKTLSSLKDFPRFWLNLLLLLRLNSIQAFFFFFLHLLSLPRMVERLHKIYIYILNSSLPSILVLLQCDFAVLPIKR